MLQPLFLQQATNFVCLLSELQKSRMISESTAASVIGALSASESQTNNVDDLKLAFATQLNRSRDHATALERLKAIDASKLSSSFFRCWYHHEMAVACYACGDLPRGLTCLRTLILADDNKDYLRAHKDTVYALLERYETTHPTVASVAAVVSSSIKPPATLPARAGDAENKRVPGGQSAEPPSQQPAVQTQGDNSANAGDARGPDADADGADGTGEEEVRPTAPSPQQIAAEKKRKEAENAWPTGGHVPKCGEPNYWMMKIGWRRKEILDRAKFEGVWTKAVSHASIAF